MEKLLELPSGDALFLTVIAIPETFQSVFVFHLFNDFTQDSVVSYSYRTIKDLTHNINTCHVPPNSHIILYIHLSLLLHSSNFSLLIHINFHSNII